MVNSQTNAPISINPDLVEFNTQERGSDGLEGVARLLDEKDLALVAHLKEKTSGVDFVSVADSLGCIWTGTDKDSLRFKFLAQDVELSHNGILINGKEPEDRSMGSPVGNRLLRLRSAIITESNVAAASSTTSLITI